MNIFRNFSKGGLTKTEDVPVEKKPEQVSFYPVQLEPWFNKLDNLAYADRIQPTILTFIKLIV